MKKIIIFISLFFCGCYSNKDIIDLIEKKLPDHSKYLQIDDTEFYNTILYKGKIFWVHWEIKNGKQILNFISRPKENPEMATPNWFYWYGEDRSNLPYCNVSGYSQAEIDEIICLCARYAKVTFNTKRSGWADGKDSLFKGCDNEENK